MIKKIFAKLVGWREQRNTSVFSQQDSIELQQSQEHRKEAMIRAQEELREQLHRRQPPSDEKILGPSESEKA